MHGKACQHAEEPNFATGRNWPHADLRGRIALLPKSLAGEQHSVTERGEDEEMPHDCQLDPSTRGTRLGRSGIADDTEGNRTQRQRSRARHASE